MPYYESKMDGTTPATSTTNAFFKSTLVGLEKETFLIHVEMTDVTNFSIKRG